MVIKNRITGEVYYVTDTVVDWVDILKEEKGKRNEK